MSVRVEPVEDGGNPQQAAAIQRLAEGHYRVFPYSEDGDGNYKFALCVRLVNDSDRPRALALEVDWADPEYMDARRFLYLGSGDDWQFVPATVSGTVATVTHPVPPGISYAGLSPAYSLGDYLAFAERLPKLGYRCRVAGSSNEGRDIHAYELGEGDRPILVTARYHPYETSSSYCVEGMMAWLAQPREVQQKLLARHTFTFVPMPNPDGVYRGLCKRTGIGGVDLSHEGAYGGDVTTRTLLGVIDSTRPQGFLDIHGWMYMEEDGLHYLDEGLGERFAARLDGHPLFIGNKWKASLSDDRAPGSIRARAHREYGSRPLAVSYRWPGRTVPQMRDMGGPTLEAFCAALDQGVDGV
ncbi:MAG: hypothetical protein HPY83_12255 [Anaerolineae bacterium]|nr:hypothetical protein [Anaerolineae bacterium]